MNHYFSEIEELLPAVLDVGVHYTPTTAAEEFRQEYPQVFDNFMKQYAAEFEFSGCGQRRGHINGFAIILTNLEKKGIFQKITVDGSVFWEKVL